MYDKEKLFKKAKKVAKEKNLIFIEEIVSYLPCQKNTFYDYFPVDSNEMHEIKDILFDNKTETKTNLRKKWYESENATLQLALYRLNSNPQEHKLLNQQHIDHTTQGDKMGGIDLTKLSDQALEELKKAKNEDNS